MFPCGSYACSPALCRPCVCVLWLVDSYVHFFSIKMIVRIIRNLMVSLHRSFECVIPNYLRKNMRTQERKQHGKEQRQGGRGGKRGLIEPYDGDSDWIVGTVFMCEWWRRGLGNGMAAIPPLPTSSSALLVSFSCLCVCVLLVD